MDALILTKGQSLELKKADGSAISKIRVGLSWDIQGTETYDLDLFIVHKETKTVAYFNAKDAIKGITLGDDNLTGAGDGDDEFALLDATQSVDGTYTICVNIYSAESRKQSFANVANAKVTVYNSETNDILASYTITENGGAHTALVVGEVKDSGDNYTFTAKGDFLTGDITQIRNSL